MFNNVLELVGNTPLVKVNKLNPNPRAKLYVKLEGMNPGGSIKDRICVRIVEQAEKEGKLNNEKVILEPTSGNTGIGLAMVAAVKGYKCLLVMPASVSLERLLILRALGAEIILTPPEKGVDGAIEEALRIYRENPDTYFMPDQFNNPENPRAHYLTTGPEIWQDTRGQITHLVAGLGTSGTLVGTGKYLKERNPQIRVIAAEPERGHRIQGLKSLQESRVPGIYEDSVIDEKVIVPTEKAFEFAMRLTREEGIFAGQSSGAVMYAAYVTAEKLDSGFIVAVLPDFGYKYLMCEPYYDREVELALLKARTGEKVEIRGK